MGTPERPLSDMGLISFRSYWSELILEFLHAHQQRGGHAASLTVRDITLATGFKQEDIVNTLAALNMVKFWKGQHVIVVAPHLVEEQLNELLKKPRQGAQFDPTRLLWQPKVFAEKKYKTLFPA